MGYLIVVIGLIIVVWGITIVRQNKTKTGSNQKVKSEVETSVKKSKVETSVKKSKDENFDENKAKGDAFEGFVVKHFDKKYFTLQEWRGDKYVDGNYPVSSHFPDLEVKFHYEKQKVNENFAIECKWRKYYFENSIEWAKDYQIKNYKEYANKLKIPVFVVIGVGGEPNNPYELFIVPLEKMKANVISKDELAKYKKDLSDPYFFWDYEKNQLK